jgi:hypothetical protein
MSITYNTSTNFGAKDALPVNDPNKVIYGSDFTTEFVAIGTAFGEAAPTANPTFTGTATFSGDVALNGSVTLDGESISDTDVQNWNATKATVDAGATGWDATEATVNAGAAGWDDTKATVDAGASDWDEAHGWGDHSLAGYGTSSSDTTYTAGTNITLNDTTFNLDASLTGLTDVSTSNVSIGNFNVKLSGASLRIDHSGTALFRIDNAGNVVAKGNITAYGNPS